MKISTYNYLRILDAKEKQKIIDMLNEQFGISEIKGLIVQRGKERLFLFHGNFSSKKIKELEKTIPIERVGVYFAKIIQERDSSGRKRGKIKLSIEGTQILRSQIKKNIFQLRTEKELEEWMMGRELNIETNLRGFVVISYKGEFLGCGKASKEKITNFIPKNRRLKEKAI